MIKLASFMITDNQNEIFDVVDEEDKVIGRATRGEVHQNKRLIHRSVGVVIFNSRGEIFLQQRSKTKDTDPLKWTISCTGHVGAAGPKNFAEVGHDFFAHLPSSPTPPPPADSWCSGNGGRAQKAWPPRKIYEEAAHRELWEELGIKALEIEPVTKYICRAPNETEIQMLYKMFYDGPFKLNRKEIIQGKFFTRNELVKLVHLGKLELSFMGKVALSKLGWI